MRIPSILLMSAVLVASTASAGEETGKASGDFHPAQALRMGNKPTAR